MKPDPILVTSLVLVDRLIKILVVWIVEVVVLKLNTELELVV
jgi:hypothetical protein